MTYLLDTSAFSELMREHPAMDAHLATVGELDLKQANSELSWAERTLPPEFGREISSPAAKAALLACPLAAKPPRRSTEGFLNPFFAGASDTASAHCACQKSQGRYPLALTGAICRTRSHVAKKSFNQLLYPRIR